MVHGWHSVVVNTGCYAILDRSLRGSAAASAKVCLRHYVNCKATLWPVINTRSQNRGSFSAIPPLPFMHGMKREREKDIQTHTLRERISNKKIEFIIRYKRRFFWIRNRAKKGKLWDIFITLFSVGTLNFTVDHLCITILASMYVVLYFLICLREKLKINIKYKCHNFAYEESLFPQSVIRVY